MSQKYQDTCRIAEMSSMIQTIWGQTVGGTKSRSQTDSVLGAGTAITGKWQWSDPLIAEMTLVAEWMRKKALGDVCSALLVIQEMLSEIAKGNRIQTKISRHTSLSNTEAKAFYFLFSFYLSLCQKQLKWGRWLIENQTPWEQGRQAGVPGYKSGLEQLTKTSLGGTTPRIIAGIIGDWAEVLNLPCFLFKSQSLQKCTLPPNLQHSGD